VLDSPSKIELGVAVSEAVTGPPTVTVTSTNSDAPPRPAQVRRYVEVTLGVTSWTPPAVALAPAQSGSSSLLAVQLVAFTLAQVKVLDPPRAIARMSALSVATGAAPTVTVTSTNSDAPPRPSQLSL
jgi:hypothetical protein